jgi:hypothetical protein
MRACVQRLSEAAVGAMSASSRRQRRSSQLSNSVHRLLLLHQRLIRSRTRQVQRRPKSRRQGFLTTTTQRPTATRGHMTKSCPRDLKPSGGRPGQSLRLTTCVTLDLERGSTRQLTCFACSSDASELPLTEIGVAGWSEEQRRALLERHSEWRRQQKKHNYTAPKPPSTLHLTSCCSSAFRSARCWRC